MAIEILVPRLGWTMEEGVFVEWLKRDGETVRQGDLIFRLEGDKALTEVESMDDGILRIPPDAPQPGATVPVGALLGYLVAPGERAPFEPSLPVTPSPPLPTSSAPAAPTISPRALRVAKELGVDWAALRGSGRTGRIVEADVRKAAAQSTAQPPTARRVPVSPTRRVIAERMAAGLHVAAPVTLSSEVDATELVRLREQLKQDKKATVIPSYSDLLAKIAAHALLEHPALNARLEEDEIVTDSAVHMGIAVDTERGLLAPVVRDAQAKSLLQIAAETRALIERTRTGKATADELRGSTFTVSNLGMYEIDAFSPVINLPECAILGLGRIVAKQVVTLRPGSIDEIERVSVRRMMTLSLTFDHRLVDGAPAAAFLQRVKHLVEQPYLWLVT
ncbi:MAG: 2-oxo acid dehydrogenase subunit E2 [Chloroflexi bacterium]|nr:2-oxo acid dehydrogenase subunit E2 [Chloroflexota bacterium]MCL5274522.1 2-oxo acid dehydrogenase subunit E2 [Chloroflexota bacterium]